MIRGRSFVTLQVGAQITPLQFSSCSMKLTGKSRYLRCLLARLNNWNRRSNPATEQAGSHVGRQVFRESTLQTLQERTMRVAIGVDIAGAPRTRFQVQHFEPLPDFQDRSRSAKRVPLLPGRHRPSVPTRVMCATTQISEPIVPCRLRYFVITATRTRSVRRMRPV